MEKCDRRDDSAKKRPKALTSRGRKRKKRETKVRAPKEKIVQGRLGIRQVQTRRRC